MPPHSEFQPASRKAWRAWLKKHHASSSGIWLVFAKKHTGIPSLTYNDAVEEALCFGWIDSLVHPIDDKLFRQVYTPRKPRSKWSALNRTRVERLIAAGSMTDAGMATIELAKKTGTWDAMKHRETGTIPPDFQKAIDAKPAAKKNWRNYSPSMQKMFVYRVIDAKRPETRAARITETVAMVARNMSRAQMMERAGFSSKKKTAKSTKKR